MWEDVRRQREKADTLGAKIEQLEAQIEGDRGDDVDTAIVNSNKYNTLRESKPRLRNITKRWLPLLFGPRKRDEYLKGVEAQITDLETHLANKNSPKGKEFLEWLEGSIRTITDLYETRFQLKVPRATVVNLIRKFLRTKERTDRYIKELKDGSISGFVSLDGVYLPYDHSFGGRKRKTRRPRRTRRYKYIR